MKALIPNWIQFISTSFTCPLPQTTFRFHNNVRYGASWKFEPKPEWVIQYCQRSPNENRWLAGNVLYTMPSLSSATGDKAFLFFSLRPSVVFCSVHRRHRLGDLGFLILVMRSSGAQLQRVSSPPTSKVYSHSGDDVAAVAFVGGGRWGTIMDRWVCGRS